MTDKELLELAAKAAEIEITWFDGVSRNTTNSHPCMNIYAFPIWNPLIDDGDALRLAVKLGLDIEWFTNGNCVACNEYVTTIDSDIRRAIVRAAAEIGKDKQ